MPQALAGRTRARGAEPGASRPQVSLEQGCIGGIALAEPAAEEAADEEGADVFGHSPGKGDELSQGGAERDL